MTLTWQDVDEIAAALAANHPGRNPLQVAPRDIAALVAALPGFIDDPGASTAPLLEAIQAAWYEVSEE
jgi:FeS assembly protein IscX